MEKRPMTHKKLYKAALVLATVFPIMAAFPAGLVKDNATDACAQDVNFTGTTVQINSLPAAGIDDTAGNGDTGVVWSADKTYDEVLSAGASAGGATTQIQFNNASVLDGDADLVWATLTSALTLGKGGGGEVTLTAHLNQDDVLIKRDVDGDGALYSEAGSLLHLWRDVTAVDGESGNFLECSTDGATPLFKIGADGGATAAGLITANAGIDVKNGATSAGFLKIYEDSDDGGHSVTIIGQALAGDYTLTLPTTDGDASQYLKTDGSGGLSWDDPPGGGAGTVDTSGAPVDDDWARFTDADTIEGRSDTEIVSDLSICQTANATQYFVVPFTIPDDDGKIGHPAFTGAGPNDMFTSGTYGHQSALTYVVTIDAAATPDTFKWSDDGGSTWDASTVNITGAAQTLNNGVQVKFLATTGHTNTDSWTFLTTGAETDDLQFQVQIDDSADYASTIIDHDSRDVGDGGDGQTGCEYSNGSAFVAWPASGGTGAGVVEAYHGLSGSYTFQSASISRGTEYYWQIRVHDGTSWSNWAGRTISW